MRLNLFQCAVAAALLLAISAAGAAEVTRAELDAWLAESPLSDAPAAGRVLGQADIGTLRAYLPPAYVEEFDYPGVAIEIQATMAYPGHPAFVAATTRFAGQASLGAGGELENYTAGRPFSDAQITAATLDQAGLMVAWNQIHRWQYSGYQVDELTMTYLNAAGSGEVPSAADGLEGGGNVERRLTQQFQRVYLSRLAWLPEQDYRIDVSGSDKYLYKDYIGFLAPFNVSGTRFVVERALDPRADDQVNTYLPTERRVRRFSAKERADSFMGSDVTLDDFDGFAGRVLDYTWTYLGRKALLDVIDADQVPLRFGGPLSRAVIDRWQLRDCHVVELRSTWEGHPYKSRLLFVDAETYDVSVALAFNHDDVLWKVFDPIYRAARGNDEVIETSVSSWRGQVNIDLLGGTATLARAVSDTLHPHMAAAAIRRRFSVSSLTAGQ